MLLYLLLSWSHLLLLMAVLPVTVESSHNELRVSFIKAIIYS